MTETLLIQALTGLVAAGVGSFSSYKLLEWRISQLEAAKEHNEEEHKKFRTAGQHEECKNLTCGKIAEVKMAQQDQARTLNQVKACINKHVEGCQEIV
jgi:hypothetical protein